MAYLDECSYKVDLEKLYKFMGTESTCAYNAMMEYIPIQVEISDALKSMHKGKNYLMQVWNNKGECIFERELEHKVTKWAICFQYFIFLYEDEKDSHGQPLKDNGKFQVWNLQTNGCTKFNSDPFRNPKEEFVHFAVNDNKFYAANSTQIWIAPLKLNNKKDQQVTRKVYSGIISKIDLKKQNFELNQSEVEYNNAKTVSMQLEIDSKIHGIAVPEFGLSGSESGEAKGDTKFLYVFIEIHRSEEYRISMNKLVIEDSKMFPYATDDNFFVFNEHREYSFAAQESQAFYKDAKPIRDYQFVFNYDGIHVGVARHENNQFDIYYDGIFIDGARTSESNEREVCTNFIITYDHIIFEVPKKGALNKQGKKKKNPLKKGSKRWILKHNEPYANKMASYHDQEKNYKFGIEITERIKDQVKLFSGLIIVETNVFVSHGRFLSHFYLSMDNQGKKKDQEAQFVLDPEKVKIIEFPYEIKFLFKRRGYTEKGKLNFSVGVLLNDGTLHLVKSEDTVIAEAWQHTCCQDDDGPVEEINGKVLDCFNDPVQFKCNLFLAQCKVSIESLDDEQSQTPRDTINISNYDGYQKDTMVDESLKESVMNPKDGELPGFEAAAQEIELEQVRAFVFTEKLHDITDKLRALQIVPQEDDQMVGIYERDSDLPHFIYYQRKLKKIHLFQFKILTQYESIETQLNFVEEMNEGRMRNKWAEMAQRLSGKPLEEELYLLEKVADCVLNQKQLIMRDFPKAQNQPVWQDIDPTKFRINNVILSREKMLVFTNNNCYNISANARGAFSSKHIKIFPNICWKGFFLADLKHIYLIRDKKDGLEKGLSYFDIAKVFEPDKNQTKSNRELVTWLQPAQVGIQSVIDYSFGIQRFAYIKSYNEIGIVPNLHLNQISLIDQQRIDTVLAVKQVQDAFYSLNHVKRGGQSYCELTTWDIVTGKKKMIATAKSHPKTCKLIEQYVHYERFNKNSVRGDPNISGLHDKFLLIKKEKEYNTKRVDLAEDEEDNKQNDDLVDKIMIQYFDPNQLEGKFKRQTTYVKDWKDSDKKDFHCFKLIEIKDSTEVKEWFEFQHPKYAEQQELFFNQSATLMIEWLSHGRINLYTKVLNSQKEVHQYKTPIVSWKKLRKMQNLENFGRKDFLDVVSPDFKNFISIDRSKKTFKLLNLKDEEENLKIPNFLMNYKNSPAEALHSFKWVGDDTIKIINKEGIEKVVNVANSEFKQIAFNMICNYDHCEEQGRNYYSNRAPLSPKDVTQRLIRRYQAFKSAQSLAEKENPNEKVNLYDSMFGIDFQGSNIDGKFYTDMSFSYITWRNIESLNSQKIEVSDLDQSSIEQLAFSILPEGQTFLHRLVDKPEIISAILETFKKLNVERKAKNKKALSFPYLRDMNDTCPIQLCLDRDLIRTIDVILRFLNDQPLDHHSKFISGLLHELVEKGLNNLNDYLFSLTKQTTLIQKVSRKELLESREFGPARIMVTDLWTHMPLISKTLFADSKQDGEKQKMTDVEMYFIDMPKLHEFGEESTNFFKVLSDTENLELFDIPFIQQQINFKWDIVKYNYIISNFVPSVIQLVASMIYVVYFMHDRIYQKLGDYWIVASIIEQIQVIMAFYILHMEFKQLTDMSFGEYISDFWNINDIVAPIIIIMLSATTLAGFTVNLADNNDKLQFFSISFSIAILCLWFKVLHFLRIFDATNFLVRAIFSCIQNVIIFLGIFLVILTGVGSANLVMQQANSDTNKFFEESGAIKALFGAYLVALGEFSLDENGEVAPVYVQILFVITSVLCMVIMLNLFIAIVSDEFDRLNQQKERASYREKASLIFENMGLLNEEGKQLWAQKDGYLLYVKDLKEDKAEEEGGVAVLKNFIQDENEKINSSIDVMEARFYDLIQKVEAMQKSNNQDAEETVQESEVVAPQATSLEVLKLEPREYEVTYDNPTLRKMKKSKTQRRFFKRGTFRGGEPEEQQEDDQISTSEKSENRSLIGGIGSTLSAPVVGGGKLIGNVVGGAANVVGGVASGVAGAVAGQVQGAIPFLPEPPEKQVAKLLNPLEDVNQKLYVKGAGNMEQTITIKYHGAGWQIFRAIGLKSADFDVKSCPSEWELLVSQTELEEDFEHVHLQHETQFSDFWQTKQVILPFVDGGYKFKMIRLKITANGRHPDLSLGQIILFK